MSRKGFIISGKNFRIVGHPEGRRRERAWLLPYKRLAVDLLILILDLLAIASQSGDQET